MARSAYIFGKIRLKRDKKRRRLRLYGIISGYWGTGIRWALTSASRRKRGGADVDAGVVSGFVHDIQLYKCGGHCAGAAIVCAQARLGSRALAAGKEKSAAGRISWLLLRACRRAKA